MNSNRAVTIVALSFAVAVISWKVLRKRCHRKKCGHSQPSNEWQYIGKLQEIALYPFKSGAAIELNAAVCDVHGLRTAEGLRDRRLMVFDANDGSMAWAGSYPRMLSIKTQILSGQNLRLIAPHMEDLHINLDEIIASGRVVLKQKKGYRLPLVECAPAQNTWICRAVLQKDDGLKLYVALDAQLDKSWWRRIEHDLMPVMIMHDKSVEDLNKRLSAKNHAHHQQFRGNLLISTEQQVQPFDEDKWLWLKIGNETTLRFAAPCLRCILPNIDIKSYERNPDFEPLKTLKSYRLRSHPKEPEMGVYFEIYKEGSIQKGDSVYVQYM